MGGLNILGNQTEKRTSNYNDNSTDDSQTIAEGGSTALDGNIFQGDYISTETSTDYGALENALTLTESALLNSSNNLDSLIGGVETLADTSVNFAEINSGVLDRAFDSYDDALGVVGKSVSETFDFGETALEMSFGYGSDSQNKAYGLADTSLDLVSRSNNNAVAAIQDSTSESLSAVTKSVNKSIDTIKNLAAGSSSEISNNAIKVLGFSVAAIVGVGILARYKK